MSLPKMPGQQLLFQSSAGLITLSSELPLSLVLACYGSDDHLSDADIIKMTLKRTAKVSEKSPTDEFLDKLDGVDIEGISINLLQLADRSASKEEPPSRTFRRYILSNADQLYANTTSLQGEAARAFSLFNPSESRLRLSDNAIANITPPRPVPNGVLAVDKLTERVEERRAIIGEGRHISLVAISAPGEAGFFVSKYQASGEYVILTGISAKEGERPSEIIQHYSQLNIMITDVPVATSGIGFV